MSDYEMLSIIIQMIIAIAAVAAIFMKTKK